MRPTYMMKRKALILLVMLAALLLAGFAAAETADPIVTSMEISPKKLTGPGTVNVTITISNSGDADLTEPVWLYDPAAQIVTDFGSEGAALLKAGESKTWTGTYDVNQRTLENGSVVYFVKYTLIVDGKAVAKSQPIREKISIQSPEADMDVERTISPSIASEGQEIVVRYDIINSGTLSLLDVTIQEHKDINNKKQTIPELKPGQTAEIKYPVVMGKKDLTSGATITYKTEADGKAQTYKVEEQTIRFGVPSLEARLSSNVKGVVQNGTVTLTLELKNTGSVDYSDIRVTDPALGDVFANQELKAGASLELARDVTVPESMEYCFTVTGTDATGMETSIITEKVTVTAVDPADALSLDVVATPDKTEVFEQPGNVRFTIEITNNSNVDAKNVKVSHGETTLYTFDSIAAGETRRLTRDTALSMAGKYRFTVSATDPLDSTLTFESNEMQIAFSAPTPAPSTPTPKPEPTAEPTFTPATVPPKDDPSVGAMPKLIHSILIVVVIVAGVLLAACAVLLLMALIRRSGDKKKLNDLADRLERVKRRDYVTPAEEETAEEESLSQEPENALQPEAEMPQVEEDYELPHMKFARDAVQNMQPEEVEETIYGSEGEEQPSGEYQKFYDDTIYDDVPMWENNQTVEEAPQPRRRSGNFTQPADEQTEEGSRRTRRSRGTDLNA